MFTPWHAPQGAPQPLLPAALGLAGQPCPRGHRSASTPHQSHARTSTRQPRSQPHRRTHLCTRQASPPASGAGTIELVGARQHGPSMAAQHAHVYARVHVACSQQPWSQSSSSPGLSYSPLDPADRLWLTLDRTLLRQHSTSFCAPLVNNFQATRMSARSVSGMRGNGRRGRCERIRRPSAAGT